MILFTPEADELRAVLRDTLVAATIDELRAKGLEIRGEPGDRG